VPADMQSVPPPKVRDVFRQWSLEPSPAQWRAFARYVDLLARANQHTNLTAYREPEALWLHLIADALSPIPHGLNLHHQRAVDVGSGAGIPGWPLALWFPDSSFTLIEATGKKARFLRDVAEALQRPVEVLAQRAEVIGHDPAHREQYDWAFARAVASLPTVLEYMAPLVRPGGRLVVYKGSRVQDEIAQAQRALDVLGLTLERVIPVQGLPYPRTLVWLRKTHPTPTRYPRRPGIPAKRPL